MADKLIFEVHVEIDGKSVSFSRPAGEVVMIPFTGTVTGELLNGKVFPAGWTQRVAE